MKLKAIGVIVLLCAAFFTVGCDGQNPPPAPSTPTAGSGPGPTASLPAITFATSGGIAGVQRELSITPEGFATLSERGETFGPVTLSAERIAETKTKLAATNFKELEERYGTGTVADDFQRTLTVVEGSSTKSVTVEEIGGKEVTPQAVQDLFALMSKIEDEVRESDGKPTPSVNSYKGKISYRATREVNGQNWEMTISEGGEATILDAGQVVGKVQLPPDRMAQIETLFEEANFFNLKAYYGTGRLGPNERINTLTLQTPSNTKVVTLEEVSSTDQTTPQTAALFRTIYNTLVGARTELLGTPTSSR